MALPASGQIGFGQIITEFKSTNNQTENEISDYYSGAGLVTSATGPNVPTSGEIRWSDFYNASNVSGSVDASWSMTNWQINDTFSAVSGYAQTYGYVQFYRDNTNNRIVINWADGTTSSTPTVYTGYVTYSNLGTITSIEAQYNVSSQSCDDNCASTSSSIPVGGEGSFHPATYGLSSGSYYTVPNIGALRFEWLAESNPNQNLTGEISGSFPFALTGIPHFRIKVVSGAGTFYSTSSISNTTISLTASNSSGGGGGGFPGGGGGGIGQN